MSCPSCVPCKRIDLFLRRKMVPPIPALRGLGRCGRMRYGGPGENSSTVLDDEIPPGQG